MDCAQIFQGPVDEYGFSIDVLAGHPAPTAAVVGGAAMVAQDEILIGRNDFAGHRDGVSIILGNVRLGDGLAVDDDPAIVDLNDVAGDADHALDVRLGRIARIEKNNGVAASNIRDAEAVDELINENT